MPIHVPILVALLAVAGAATILPAAAQPTAAVAGGVISSPTNFSGPPQREETVVVQSPGLAETAVASCAGGAAIGYLVVVATGFGSAIGTPALYCGLSVAASVASTVATWTWRSSTAQLR
jgi:hypothetical protein